MITLPEIFIGGTRFHRVTMPEAVERIHAMAARRDKARYVCTGNLDHLAILQVNSAMRAAYESADLVLADGMPVVWLSRLVAAVAAVSAAATCDLRYVAQQRSEVEPLPERVTGADLFWELGSLSAREGVRLFFLGGSEGSAESAAEALRNRFPGAQICGTYCPPFETFGTEDEQTHIRERIQAAAPDILLVAFGAPKQEDWIRRNCGTLGVPVSIGVGGSFEMASGVVRRAPVWIQRCGMEWLFRMAQEPRRLVQRYLGRDLPTLAVIAAPLAVAFVSACASRFSERLSMLLRETAL